MSQFGQTREIVPLYFSRPVLELYKAKLNY